MRFKILNFAKYNPRGDVKNPSWVRLERTWWIDMFSWTADAQRVWFMLLGLVCDFEAGTGEIAVDFAASNLHLTESDVLEALSLLKAKKRLELEVTELDEINDHFLCMKCHASVEKSITNENSIDTAEMHSHDRARACAAVDDRARPSAGVTNETDGRTDGRDEGGGGAPRPDAAEPFRLSGADAPPRLGPTGLMKLWNEERGPLPEVQRLSKDRERAAKARIAENPDPGYWRKVIRRIAASSFCRGVNQRGWKADIDFLLRPGSAVKALEGKYDDRIAGQGSIDWSKIGEETPT